MIFLNSIVMASLIPLKTAGLLDQKKVGETLPDILKGDYASLSCLENKYDLQPNSILLDSGVLDSDSLFNNAHTSNSSQSFRGSREPHLNCILKTLGRRRNDLGYPRNSWICHNDHLPFSRIYPVYEN